MDWIAGLALFLCAISTLTHVVTAALTAFRCRRRSARPMPLANGTRFSVVRPMRGLDQYDVETLRSGFELENVDYELLLCCEDADDPAVRAATALIRAHPHVNARLLVGREKASPNPKLNNCIKGWEAARHEWVILADCNVLMPQNYASRLMAAWRADTGLVCSPPLGSKPQGFWAEVECAFLNTFQARWQYAADTAGLGFAQGKSMLWRKADLDERGGIRALGAEIAEDAAATKIVRARGLRVRLVDGPFEQPLGYRSRSQIWNRQVRWSRLRRVTFAAFFIPEILAGSLVPISTGLYAAHHFGFSIEAALTALMLTWFGAEALLAAACGWHISAVSPLAWLLRDLMLPVLWISAWAGDSFEWRGNEMRVSRQPGPAE